MNVSLETTSRTRLALADVAAPILLDVEARHANGLTVARSLPFLSLGRAVRDEDGRLAHIESVHVEVDEDTPRLVMDLIYGRPGRDATLSYETPSRLPPPPSLPSDMGATREGTLLFVTPQLAEGEERVSMAPVRLYEDTEALRDGLRDAGLGLWTAGRAALALSLRASVAMARSGWRLLRRAWSAFRHLGATYADSPPAPATP